MTHDKTTGLDPNVLGAESYAETWFKKLREHKSKMPTHDFTPAEYRSWNNERNILMNDLWTAAVKGIK